ncbi:hypothetical protein EDC54_101604 [Samsonia erythrinae]|uniref:Uncharacterized protein n=2 Tax=Samsonia erythrinae TaxID=160434 RepID=A0A4R3VUA2_9GAMM|nr:hypothetical protein EDC54_101604 [Samsonia erythrinae]
MNGGEMPLEKNRSVLFNKRLFVGDGEYQPEIPVQGHRGSMRLLWLWLDEL